MGVKQVLVRPRYGHGHGDADGSSNDEVLLLEDQSSSPPPMSSCGRYILHRVCRFDTLAGVAIKYGVEVADVKRANGLTTDLQMFAHKTLRVPLHGRHPPATAPSSSPSHAHRARFGARARLRQQRRRKDLGGLVPNLKFGEEDEVHAR